MKEVKIDTKGLPCPQPVVLAKKAISQIETGKIIVYVDNETAKENVKKNGRK